MDGSTAFAGSSSAPSGSRRSTKSFTATALWEAGSFDERARTLLSHTAGYRPEAASPLPPECAGLWSNSNAGYLGGGVRLRRRFGGSAADVLRTVGLNVDRVRTPPGPAVLGRCRTTTSPILSYPEERRPSGGLWSTVGDLVTYGPAHRSRWPELTSRSRTPWARSTRRPAGARRRPVTDRGLGRRLPVAAADRPLMRLVLAVLDELVAREHRDPVSWMDLGLVRLAPALMQARDGVYRLDTMKRSSQTAASRSARRIR